MMSRDADDRMYIPPHVESELDRLLGVWASARRLAPEDLATIRSQVLARVAAAPEPERLGAIEGGSGFDADWLWSLLRPVTRLIESNTRDDRLAEHLETWLRPLSIERVYQPYLRLT